MTQDIRTAAEQVVRTLYGHVARGDFAAVTALLADDVVVTQAASLPFGGQWKGKAGFGEMAGRILAMWPDFRVKPRAYLTDGESRVAVLARIRGRSAGAGLDMDMDMDMLELWTVHGGRVSACQPFYFDTSAAAALAASMPQAVRPGN